MFFRKVEPLLRRHLEKAERENSFIYHQSVPDECPSLEKSVGAKETSFGLVKPESFELPSFAEVILIIMSHDHIIAFQRWTYFKCVTISLYQKFGSLE